MDAYSKYKSIGILRGGNNMINEFPKNYELMNERIIHEDFPSNLLIRLINTIESFNINYSK